MAKILISKIKVRDRFRKEFGDMAGLALSIQKYGLLHPICVTPIEPEGPFEVELVAGERRLRAHVSLGLEKIEVNYLKELSDIDRREIEIEENLARKDFNWKEEVVAKLAIDQLKREKYGHSAKGHKTEGWTLRNTAEALGQSLGTVSMDIQLAEALFRYPDLAKEKNKTTAFKKFKKMRESSLRMELARRGTFEILPFVYCGDCTQVMREKVKTESVGMILTSPQFGVQLGSQSIGVSSAVYKQDDTEYRVHNQLDLALREMYRVLKDGSHLYVFFASCHHTAVKRLLEKHFIVNPDPIIWDKEQQGNPGNLKGYTSCYEPCFFCSKGTPKELNAWNKNVLHFKGVPGKKRIHETEMPTPLLRVFIEASSLPGDTVLDPYGGSGSTGEAALELGRKAIVIDIDERYYDGMLERLKKYKKKGEKK